jgi:LPXTG-motif cell wall-anchored protein
MQEGIVMLRKVVTLAALLAAAVVVLVSPAWAAYPPVAPTVGTTSSVVANGGHTTVVGTGWQAGAKVALSIASTPQSLGSVTVKRDGTFSKNVKLPCVDAGSHTISASGTAADGTANTANTTISVTGACDPPADPPADPPNGHLPHTGSNVGSLLLLVAGLMTLGAVLVIATARRRANSDL